MDPVTLVRLWTLTKPIKRIKNRRKKKRHEKQLTEVEVDTDMARYNKLIGSIIGGVLGIIAIQFPILSWLGHPELVNVITVAITSAAFTYFSPKNSG